MRKLIPQQGDIQGSVLIMLIKNNFHRGFGNILRFITFNHRIQLHSGEKLGKSQGPIHQTPSGHFVHIDFCLAFSLMDQHSHLYGYFYE